MILVTGASGTVGSELLKQLRATGSEVRAGFHSVKKADAARASGVEAVTLDFADAGSVAKALQGVEKLFLLGATAPDQPQREIGVVREARKAGVKHIVKLSVLYADREECTFARWHREVEQFIEASGVSYTHLRATGFMQNFVTYAGEQIRTQGAFYEPEGQGRTSHVDVRDIAAVAVQALAGDGHENKAYEITGPEPLTYAEVAEKLSAATGREVRYVGIPDAAYREGAIASGVPEFFADALLDLAAYYRTGRAAEVSDAVEKTTGRKPLTFDQFAKDYAPAWK